MICSFIACLLPPKEFPIELPGVKFSVIKRWPGAVYDPAPHKVGCLSEDGAAVWDTRLNQIGTENPHSWTFQNVDIYSYDDSRGVGWGMNRRTWRLVTNEPPYHKAWEVTVGPKVSKVLLTQQPNTEDIWFQSDNNGALWFSRKQSGKRLLVPDDKASGSPIIISERIKGGYFYFPNYFNLRTARFASYGRSLAALFAGFRSPRRLVYELPFLPLGAPQFHFYAAGGIGLLRSGMLIQAFEIGGRYVLDQTRSHKLIWCPDTKKGTFEIMEISRNWVLLAVTGSGRKALFARLKDLNQVTPLSGRIGNNIAETVLVTIREEK